MLRLASSLLACALFVAIASCAQAQTSCQAEQNSPPATTIQVCTKDLSKHLSSDVRYRDYLVRAAAYNRSGEFDSGLADANAALALKPADVYAQIARGALYANKGMAAEATADFESALEQEPSNTFALLGLGDAEMLANQFDKAIDEYSLAITTHPEFIQAYLHRAKVYGRKGRCDLAAKDEDQVLKRDPANIGAMMGQAYCSLWTDDAEGAVRETRKC